MAIIKPVETPQGVTATYHKLLTANIDTRSESIDITVAIYASQEARDDGKNVLWHERQSVPFSVLTQDPRDLLYPLLAAYTESFLVGGLPDPTFEGFEEPGNSSIGLKPEVTRPTPPSPPPHPSPPSPPGKP